MESAYFVMYLFEQTQEDFFLNSNLNLNWGCQLHQSDIFVMFTTMRMRQYSYTKNLETKKINRIKKKSKLVAT